MSLLSWNPQGVGSESLALFQGPNPQNLNVPGEILELQQSGSRVDLLNNIPPPAAETNWGNILNLTPSVNQVSANNNFRVYRTGWYDVIVNHMTLNKSGGFFYIGFMIDAVVRDTSGNVLMGSDQRFVYPNVINPSYPSIKIRCYLNPGAIYNFAITFSQDFVTDPTLEPPPPVLLATADLSFDNVYIFPIVSAIDGAGDSAFVLV